MRIMIIICIELPVAHEFYAILLLRKHYETVLRDQNKFIELGTGQRT